MHRLLVLVCLLAALSGCGFHPRASLAVATTLGPVKVHTVDPYSPLGQGLSTALARAGAQAAVEGQPSSTLRVLAENLDTRPLAVDERAQVREYEIRYRVQFDLIGADGTTVLAPQWVELRREFVYDSLDSLGSPAEQALLQKELRREMEAAILRRIDAVLRAG